MEAATWPVPFHGLLPSYHGALIAFACSFLSYIILHYYSRRRIQLIFVNWPVVGMLPAIISHFPRLHDYIAVALSEAGGTFMFKGPWFLGMDFLVTCDPANVNHVFNVNFPNFPKGEEFVKIFDILGNSILSADGESWRVQRKMAHAFLGDSKLKSFMERSGRRKVEEGLIPILSLAAQNGGAIDLQDVFMRLSFDLACTMVFGVDLRGLSPDLPTIPFAEAIDDASEALHFRHAVPDSWWKLMRWLNVGTERKMASAWKVVDAFIHEQIEKKKLIKNTINGDTTQEEVDGAPADVLTVYMDYKIDECHGMFEPVSFLRDTTLFFMLGGRDTIAIALTWFIWLIATNPEVEEKIFEELRPHAPPPDGRGPVVFGADELRSALYLHAALLESLRLYPPIPFETKEALQDETLPSGAEVSAGTKILFSIYSMARMEGVWGKDCREFKPERWISKAGKLRHEPSFKFLTFNSGPRSCLGREMAMTELKTVAAAIVYNFKIDVVEGHQVVPKNSILLYMINGLMVRVRKRVSI